MRKEQVSIGASRYEICAVRGKVLSAQKHSETHISGGSTGGQFNGSVATNVTSYTTTTQEFFLELPDGSEKSYSISTMSLPMRPGHEVEVFTVYRQGQKYGNFFALRNHSARSSAFLSPFELSGRYEFYPRYKRILISLVIFIIMAAFFYSALQSDPIGTGIIAFFAFSAGLLFIPALVRVSFIRWKAASFLSNPKVRSFINDESCRS